MPRTREQFDEIRASTRERILKGAKVCFALNGYAGTKVSDLAKFLGIAQGSLYNYFASKEEVFSAILEEATAQSSENFEKLRHSPLPAADKISLLSERMIQHIQEETDTAYVLVLNFRMGEEEGMSNLFTQSYGSLPTVVLGEIISQGQAEGTVMPGDPILLADYYWTVVHSLAVMKLVHKNPDVIPAKWLTRILLLDKTRNEVRLV
jgi:AcrR family transcriptional regulator